MERFPIHDARTAPTRGARAYLRSVRDRRGFVPHLYGALASSETALKVYGELSKFYSASSLTPTERQVVMMAVTRLNLASYCMAGHSAVAEALGVLPECIGALRTGKSLDDPRLEALRRFTESTYYCRGRADNGAWTAFESAGYTPTQALEVLVGVSLKVFSNFASRMTEIPLDEGYRHWVWSEGQPPPAQDAP
jgi:AhpD family alkylhydroperoxidase